MKSDPPRLRDDPSTPDGLGQLLAHGQPPPALDAATKAASLAQLGAVGAASAVTATGVKLWLIVGGIGVAAITAVTGVVVTSSEPVTETVAPVVTELPAPEPAAAPLQEPAPEAQIEPEPVPTPAPTIRRRPTNPPAPATDTLLVEAAILEQARGLLQSDPRATLRATRDHAREHPRGQLRAERELIAIDALRRLGRRRQAQERARSFLESASTGIYADRARQILEDLNEDL